MLKSTFLKLHMIFFSKKNRKSVGPGCHRCDQLFGQRDGSTFVGRDVGGSEHAKNPEVFWGHVTKHVSNFDFCIFLLSFLCWSRFFVVKLRLTVQFDVEKQLNLSMMVSVN